MASIKYPIAWWCDLAMNYTVHTLDGLPACAVDADMHRAMAAVKKFLTWSHQREPDEPTPDLADPVVEWIEVPLRSQDTARRDRFPSETVAHVRFQYVWGRRPDDSIRCIFPKLGLSFNCSRRALIQPLAEETVRERFSGKPLSDIVAAISYSDINLDHVYVKIDQRSGVGMDGPSQESLKEIAFPLGVRATGKLFSPALNRRREVEWVAQLLVDRHRNVLLVGPPGAGKTTVLAEAAKTAIRQLKQQAERRSDSESRSVQSRSANRQRHSLESHPPFWLTNASRLIAGMQYLGQWEQRCEDVIEELAEVGGVLCIENLLALVRTGGQVPESSLAAFFKNFLANHELKMVGEATPRELETMRRLLPGFDSLFELVRVESMDDPRALEVLSAIGDDYRRNHQIEIEPAAVQLTLQLHRRFIPYDPFPGRCVKFWRRILHDAVPRRQAMDYASFRSPSPIDVDRVVGEFVKETGLPPWLIRDEVLLQPDEVRTHLMNTIIGQADSCETMVQLVLTIKAAMNDPRRPFGVFLFCGPTGVGKTELALTVSRYLFGAGRVTDRLIRLDMSEYSGPGAAQRLLTKPDGRPSPWVERVREQPFCVILLDEIEKAAPEVFDVLMNVFDEGVMVDRWGRETSFRGSVLILTSNLGTQGAMPIGYTPGGSDPYLREVRQFFRPEFFNRLDAVVPFVHLRPADIRAIAAKEVQQLTRREGLSSRNIELVCSDELLYWIAEAGYDRRLGARPLQRVIESHLMTPIARYLAEHPDRGNCQLRLDRTGGLVVLSELP